MVLMRLTCPSTGLVVQGGLHGFLVAAQAGGEPGKQGVGSSREHILQRFAALLAQQAVQALHHLDDAGQLGRVGEQPRDEPAFIVGEPVHVGHQQAYDTPAGRRCGC